MGNTIEESSKRGMRVIYRNAGKCQTLWEKMILPPRDLEDTTNQL